MNETIVQPRLYVWQKALYSYLDVWLCISLLAITLIVYAPSFSNEFQVGWDDHIIVINPYTSGGFAPGNLWAIITQFYAGQYAPLNQLYYTTIYSLFGYDAFWFHLFSIVIHYVNVLLVYSLVKKILEWTKEQNDIMRYQAPFITALLIAIHPFLVESVAWVSASKVLIYTALYILAIRAYINYLESGTFRFYLYTIALFTLSFAAKEQSVTLPLCLLLIDYMHGRDITKRKVWLEKLPLVVLTLLFAYITIQSQVEDVPGFVAEKKHYPFYQNVLFGCYAVTEYLVKCLVPVKLEHLYLFPNGTTEQIPVRFWLYPVLLVVAIASLWSFFKKKWVVFAACFFVIHLIPVLHIIPISRLSIVADRYVYVASIGIFFFIAYWFSWLIGNSQHKKVLIGAAIFYVVSLSAYANHRTRLWHDVDSLRGDFMKKLKKSIELNQPKN